METFAWEALPQRKRRRDTNPVIPTSTSSSLDVCSANDQTKTTNSNEADQRSEVQHQQTITENVRARSVLQRKNATLESLDGCAGEFYEYLDHTADVQCHCWGNSIVNAFANMAPCMFNYITDLSTVSIDSKKTNKFTVKGHDMQSLLFAYMDELLFRFSTDSFCCVKADIVNFDRENFEIEVVAYGDTFDQTLHPQGTEIKAITYSNMQIHETLERTDLYVIVDI